MARLVTAMASQDSAVRLLAAEITVTCRMATPSMTAPGKRATVLVMQGPPGVGKSTLAEDLTDPENCNARFGVWLGDQVIGRVA